MTQQEMAVSLIVSEVRKKLQGTLNEETLGISLEDLIQAALTQDVRMGESLLQKSREEFMDTMCQLIIGIQEQLQTGKLNKDTLKVGAEQALEGVMQVNNRASLVQDNNRRASLFPYAKAIGAFASLRRGSHAGRSNSIVSISDSLGAGGKFPQFNRDRSSSISFALPGSHDEPGINSNRNERGVGFGMAEEISVESTAINTTQRSGTSHAFSSDSDSINSGQSDFADAKRRRKSFHGSVSTSESEPQEKGILRRKSFHAASRFHSTPGEPHSILKKPEKFQSNEGVSDSNEAAAGTDALAKAVETVKSSSPKSLTRSAQVAPSSSPNGNSPCSSNKESSDSDSQQSESEPAHSSSATCSDLMKKAASNMSEKKKADFHIHFEVETNEMKHESRVRLLKTRHTESAPELRKYDREIAKGIQGLGQGLARCSSDKILGFQPSSVHKSAEAMQHRRRSLARGLGGTLQGIHVDLFEPKGKSRFSLDSVCSQLNPPSPEPIIQTRMLEEDFDASPCSVSHLTVGRPGDAQADEDVGFLTVNNRNAVTTSARLKKQGYSSHRWRKANARAKGSAFMEFGKIEPTGVNPVEELTERVFGVDANSEHKASVEDLQKVLQRSCMLFNRQDSTPKIQQAPDGNAVVESHASLPSGVGDDSLQKSSPRNFTASDDSPKLVESLQNHVSQTIDITSSVPQASGIMAVGRNSEDYVDNSWSFEASSSFLVDETAGGRKENVPRSIPALENPPDLPAPSFSPVSFDFEAEKQGTARQLPALGRQDDGSRSLEPKRSPVLDGNLIGLPSINLNPQSFRTILSDSSVQIHAKELDPNILLSSSPRSQVSPRPRTHENKTFDPKHGNRRILRVNK
eukprot:gnl/MRDRNA2_/MRDRNA2_37856_c0_seq1.p1 gnl/MRDRNA2_/MRDRNA2_37856_c0~~gnl/MRDRNA2_/MRDRNA2_37856_c0_seq1.p1  ORF type:complete len:889 (+),score=172.76 gnl/MRDRNA2_/MRDRNA2_37856_c0_seq1:88-2667(+)